MTSISLRIGRSYEKPQHGVFNAGFTLIEMVVALALMSFVGVVVIESMRFAQRTYSKVTQTEDALAELSSSQRLLRRLIESAYPIEPNDGIARGYGIEGGTSDVQILSTGYQASGNSGYRSYKVWLQPRDDGSYDVVASTVGLTQRATTEKSIVVSRVASMTWNYQPISDGESTNTWLTEWRNTGGLPSAIRVHIEFPAGDARVWPDLIAMPRITHDANCEFDVVAQDCRKPS